jgi:hypothetical protein
VVGLQVLQWRWEDIGDECERYFGPAGFDALQIQPPTESLNIPSAASLYFPTSHKIGSREGNTSAFVDMVKRCAEAGVQIQVDLLLNFMIKCDHPYGKDGVCEGAKGTEFHNRSYWGKDGIDLFTPQDFHHVPGNPLQNVYTSGVPGISAANLFSGDGSGPDFDTEKYSVQVKLARWLWMMFEVGVTMLRIDMAMAMMPRSILQIIGHIPWSFVLMENFAPVLTDLGGVYEVGHVLNNRYGMALTLDALFFDTQDAEGNWLDGTPNTTGLLEVGMNMTPKTCDSPESLEACMSYPPGDFSFFPKNHNVYILTNHDLFDSVNEYCAAPPLDKGGACVPTYKHGQQFNLAQLWVLAWPVTRTPKLITTFAFQEKATWNGGEIHAMPPVEDESNKASSLSLKLGPLVNGKTTADIQKPQRCKDTPLQTPAEKSWDSDKSTPWVCEHRFQGVAGLVRWRKGIGLLDLDNITEKWSDDLGHIAYSLAGEAFVALGRGFNELSQYGPKNNFDLGSGGIQTTLQQGVYCDLGSQSSPVPPESQWKTDSEAQARCKDHVKIGPDGKVSSGTLKPGHLVAIHKGFMIN